MGRAEDHKGRALVVGGGSREASAEWRLMRYPAQIIGWLSELGMRPS